MKKILVIDDDESMRMATKAVLEGAGYEVLVTRGGKEGVERARASLPDLILCDIQMPDLDGFGVIEALRESPATANIPFIFLTGLAERKDLRKGMQVGADDYLTKPFHSDDLLKAVDLRLRKRESIRTVEGKKLEELRDNISLSLPHEIRTPLTTILGFAEMLANDGAGMSKEDIVNIGTRIFKSTTRLNHWLENFLLLAEAKVWQSDPAQITALRTSKTSAWALLVDEVARDCAAQAERASDLVIKVENAEASIKEEHARRMIFELVDNALKFSAPGTKVDVVTSLEGNLVITRIKDSGKGMTAEEVMKIGAFVQFGRKRDEQQGMGLGLALCRLLAESYGGSLFIQSTPGVSTTVLLKIPGYK